MEIRRSPLSCCLAEPFSQVLRTLRPGKQTLQQRPQIQAGSADHDRQLAATGNRGDRCSRLPRVFSGGEGLAGFGYVNEMVRYQRTFSPTRLCGANLKVAVDRDGIAADDLT